MNSKAFILILALLSVNILVLMIGFWKFLKEHQSLLTLIVTFILVVITAIYVFYTKELSESSQKQLAIQLDQFKLDNRPSVFISGWGEFQKLPEMQTIRFNLKNVGRLPARFDEIDYDIIISDKVIEVVSKDFEKPSVIFPEQENMHLDLPVPNQLFPVIVKNLGFDISVKFTYYSINDREHKNQFSYFVRYTLRMKSPDSKQIDEYVLREINAT